MHVDNVVSELDQTSNRSYSIFGFFFLMPQDGNADQLLYLFGPKQHLSNTAQSNTINCTYGINIFVKHQISTKVAVRSKDESYRYSKLLSVGKKYLDPLLK